MPKDFDACVRAGGRVRTIKPKPDTYLHICYDKHGKSHAGHPKKVKGASKKSKKTRKSTRYDRPKNSPYQRLYAKMFGNDTSQSMSKTLAGRRRNAVMRKLTKAQIKVSVDQAARQAVNWSLPKESILKTLAAVGFY